MITPMEKQIMLDYYKEIYEKDQLTNPTDTPTSAKIATRLKEALEKFKGDITTRIDTDYNTRISRAKESYRDSLAMAGILGSPMGADLEQKYLGDFEKEWAIEKNLKISELDYNYAKMLSDIEGQEIQRGYLSEQANISRNFKQYEARRKEKLEEKYRKEDLENEAMASAGSLETHKGQVKEAEQQQIANKGAGYIDDYGPILKAMYNNEDFYDKDRATQLMSDIAQAARNNGTSVDIPPPNTKTSWLQDITTSVTGEDYKAQERRRQQNILMKAAKSGTTAFVQTDKGMMRISPGENPYRITIGPTLPPTPIKPLDINTSKAAGAEGSYVGVLKQAQKASQGVGIGPTTNITVTSTAKTKAKVNAPSSGGGTIGLQHELDRLGGQ